jgi:hypothetical protein
MARLSPAPDAAMKDGADGCRSCLAVIWSEFGVSLFDNYFSVRSSAANLFFALRNDRGQRFR